MLDYEVLKLIWWWLMVFLLIGFTLTGGFDLGVAILLPFAGKNDDERRLVINSVGPTWEGNQVWLVTVGAALEMVTLAELAEVAVPDQVELVAVCTQEKLSFTR